MRKGGVGLSILVFPPLRFVHVYLNRRNPFQHTKWNISDTIWIVFPQAFRKWNFNRTTRRNKCFGNFSQKLLPNVFKFQYLTGFFLREWTVEVPLKHIWHILSIRQLGGPFKADQGINRINSGETNWFR